MDNNSRRRFLKNATGLLAAGLVTNTSLGNGLKDLDESEKKREIIYRTLGRTGIKVPIVSMGVMNSSNPNLVKMAWQSGIRHFDSAWGYQGGNNERMIGKVIKELKIDRKDIIITTKISLDSHLEKPGQGEARKKQFLSRFNQSLERLQTDYVDILMYHSVNNTTEATDPYVKEAMQELKDSGKILFKAFSTHVHWPEILRVTADEGFYDVVLLSFNYSMSNDTTSLETMKYAVSKGIGLIAMKTQCQQNWYKSNLPAEMQKFYEGGIMHAALLKWVLHNNCISTSIPGFTTFEQLKIDMEVAYNLDYTLDEKKFLEDHHVVAAIQSVCRFCGGCNDTCPYGADIPALMRTQMYAASYGNLYMARSTFSSIAKENGLTACDICDACVAQCRNNVQIAQRLEELKMLMA